jgi:hypothetical protein
VLNACLLVIARNDKRDDRRLGSGHDQKSVVDACSMVSDVGTFRKSRTEVPRPLSGSMPFQRLQTFYRGVDVVLQARNEPVPHSGARGLLVFRWRPKASGGAKVE